jgi:predicted LPLAT superfamily acyltransferase
VKERPGGGRKRGNRLGFWFFKAAGSVLGLRGAYGLLYIVCLYYLLFDRRAVSPCMAYVKRRFRQKGSLLRLVDVYRIFINLGKNLIDRYFMLSGSGKFCMELSGHDKILTRLEGSDKGMVLLTAHVGNWQVTLAALKKFNRTVHLVMRREDNEAVSEALNLSGESGKINVIFTDSLLGGSVESVNALNRGEMVSIMGDRHYGSGSVETEFLGDPVNLPYSAFLLAASVECPVAVLLSARVAHGKYLVDISTVIEPRRSGRGKRMDDMKQSVTEFSEALERYVDRYPYQWFVFHDIWARDEITVKNA